MSLDQYTDQDLEKGVGLSLDELNLFQEVEAVDPDADLTDMPPPPPERADGYLAIPHLKTVDDKGNFIKLRKDRKPQFAVDFEIQDPGQRWNGLKLSTWPSPAVQRSGTSEADAIIKAYTGQSAAGLTDQKKMQFLYEKFAAQAPLRIVIEWRAEMEDPDSPKDARGFGKTKTILYGMSKFPQDVVNGEVVYRPVKTDEKTGAPVRTVARITTYRLA